MEFAADVAQALDEGPLDVHVDIFQFRTEWKLPLLNLLADGLEALLDLTAFVSADQADLREHLGMRDGAADVLRVESVVEANAFAEQLDSAIRRLLKNSAPSLVRHARSPPIEEGKIEIAETV
jgi:hypothetical protein